MEPVKCPIERTVNLIGNKWSLMIVRDFSMNDGPLRFNQLLRSLRGISSKTLSARLKQLTEYGIIEKKVVSTTPVMIHYSLTEKGKDLTRIMDSMAEWGLKWNVGESG